MRELKTDIRIPLDSIEAGLELHVYGNRIDTLYLLDEQIAKENAESPYQILEGNFYNYYFKSGSNPSNKFQLRENTVIKNALRDDVSEGRISPNVYVGNLPLVIFEIGKDNDFEGISLEVLATKLDDNNIPREDISYQRNYQFMLNDIAVKCTDLLMQINSPITQNFEIDFSKDNETIYQRFAFVSNLISNNEFEEAILKVISSPTTKWEEELEEKDTRSIRRIDSRAIRQIASKSNRIKLKRAIGKLNDIPLKINTNRKVETNDTHENRFVKHALEVFVRFCSDCQDLFQKNRYFKSVIEAGIIIEKLQNHLNHPFFVDIQAPTTLKLNSPALQRKGGYRELLNAWLKFDLAAKLIWKGGEDVYRAGKRDIAILYEYWLFFVLYDLVKSKFKLEINTNEHSYHHLIEPTKDGLNVMVKSGKLTALEGLFVSEGRELHIKFSYNRTFEGGSKYNKKNKKNSFSGSWTKALRPDYTLSIWPSEIKDEETAEELEKIVHIHFDSKYKVDHFMIKTEVESDLEITENIGEVGSDSEEKIDSLEREKREERRGIYKNADLLKMHAYKDAIRRTGGAYILYPGSESQTEFTGFHEIIPGLGAFAIKPTNGENGVSKLSDFLDKIIEHFSNRASQQRRLSSKIYDIHSQESLNVIKEPMPEYLIPDETFILVGYCRFKENLQWYKDNGIYNFRMDDDSGSLVLDNEVVNAKYLLLREPGVDATGRIFKIISKGPKVYQGSKLVGYTTDNFKDNYLVIEIEKEESSDFGNAIFNFKELEKYKDISKKFNPRVSPGVPFTVSLTELMNVKIR